jgi:DNA polymerase III alpha subunit
MSRRSLDALLDERDSRGYYVSLGNLLERVPQLAENEIENLIRCGGCDGFELTRPELLWRHALIRKERRRSRKKLPAGGRKGKDDAGRITVQTATLFPVGGTAPGAGSAVSLIPAIPDYSHTEKLQQEMEVLHLTATGHPMAMLRDWLRQRGVVCAGDIGGWAGRRVKVAGTLITAKSATVRKTGEAMKFITLEDETDLCEVTLFPKVYARYGARLLSRGPYLVTGTVEDDHGSVTVTAETLEII